MKWKEWVESQPDAEKQRRRKLIVQMISCNAYTYAWQSYEKSVKVLDDSGFALPPEQMTEVIEDVSKIGKQFGWSASLIRSST